MLKIIVQMKQKGTTVLLTSHMLDSTEPMIDRCTIVNNGRKVFDSPINAITSSGESLEEKYMDVICGCERGAPGLSWV